MSDESRKSVLQTSAVIISNDGAIVVRDPNDPILFGMPVGEKAVLTLLVLDRSGSMATHGDQPLIALNELIQNLRTTEGADRTFAGIITFAGDVRWDVQPMPATELEDRTSYVANGSTALYQAVHEALTKGLAFKKFFMDKAKREVDVVIAVITDGEDMAGPVELIPEVRKLSEEARKQGCKLLPIGIGIDAMNLSRMLGFTPGLAVTVEPTREGVSRATRTASVLFSQTMIMGFSKDEPPEKKPVKTSRTDSQPISSRP